MRKINIFTNIALFSCLKIITTVQQLNLSTSAATHNNRNLLRVAALSFQCITLLSIYQYIIWPGSESNYTIHMLIRFDIRYFNPHVLGIWAFYFKHYRNTTCCVICIFLVLVSNGTKTLSVLPLSSPIYLLSK